MDKPPSPERLARQRRRRRMAGETLREIGTLVMVFAPLDAFIASFRPPSEAANGPGLVHIAPIMVGALTLIWWGIKIEAKEG